MDSSQQVILNLQKTLGKMEIALGSISEAIVWTNSEGKIQWCNAPFDNLLSVAHIMVLGRQIQDLLRLNLPDGSPLPDDQHPFSILKNERHIDKGIFNFSKGDQPVTLEISGNSITIENDDDIYIFFVQDITRIKLNQDQLHLANEGLETRIRERAAELVEMSKRYEAILNCAVDAIISIDPKGRILSLNPAAEKMFGYSSKDIEGNNVNMLMPEPYHTEHDNYLQRYILTGESHIIGKGREVTGLKSNGELFPLDLAVSEVRFGNQLLFTGILRDISKQKTVMKDLEQARIVAEEANRAKTDFIARISHEIRTPLNAILGMADLLSESNLNKEQHKYVRVSKAAGDHLLNIIEDLLDIARIEAGKMVLDRIFFNLGELVDDVIAIVRQTAQKKELEVSCLIDGDVPLFLKGDPKRLRQVLINLMGNSIKFTETGEITLHIGMSSRICKGNDVELMFRVSDTGIGITTDMQARIFDSFSQADALITRKYGGTGLGLTICRTLVKLMRGKISVESELGKGSTFSFTARFLRSSEPTEQPEALPVHRDKKILSIDEISLMKQTPIRILLAEDSADNRLLFKTYLKKLTCIIDMAENGQIAVDKYMAGQYDIILLDIQMPVMDGYTAARMIRTHEQEKHLSPVPIIALTAHAQDSDRKASIDAGCNLHVVKPVPKKALIEAVTSLLQKK
jgi:PAS domain S-box-containing protein